ATAPDRVSAIEGGYWMYKTKHPNIVIRVDVKNYTATMYEFSGYVAFSRYVKNQTALTGDIISQTQATKDWVFDIMRWTEAYKFSVGENEIYLYDSILGSAAIGTKNSASSGYSLDSVQASLLDASIWKVLDKGTYVSPAVEINKANKYLYAVIELVDESDEKATFYVGDTDSITDFSSFQPSVVIEKLSFCSSYFCFAKDAWFVPVTTGKLFVRESSLGITSSTDITLTKK
ncbi:MAG: hypothetical protein IJS09_06765, partial [Treponema sp.]|nr:hypothetical protein [Treponema sp.]